MTFANLQSFLLRYGRPLLAIVAFAGLSYFFSSIVIYLLAGGVLALVLRPLSLYIRKIRIKGRRMPMSLAALLSILVFLGFLGLLLSMFLPLFFEQVETLSSINLRKVADNFREQINNASGALANFGIELTEEEFVKAIKESRKDLLLSPGQIGDTIGSVVAVAGELFVGLFSTLFIAFFFLRDRKIIPNVLLFMSPKQYNRPLIRIYVKVKALLRRYFTGIVIQITTLTTLISVGLWVLGFENTLFIGLFAGFINIIPYLGPFLGFLFALFISLVSHLSDTPDDIGILILKLVALFGAAQLLDNIVLQPLIYSSSVKAHPLEIFLVILVAAQIGGIGGMVVAIPTYTVIRVIAAEFLDSNALVSHLTRNL